MSINSPRRRRWLLSIWHQRTCPVIHLFHGQLKLPENGFFLFRLPLRLNRPITPAFVRLRTADSVHVETMRTPFKTLHVMRFRFFILAINFGKPLHTSISVKIQTFPGTLMSLLGTRLRHLALIPVHSCPSSSPLMNQ